MKEYGGERWTEERILKHENRQRQRELFLFQRIKMEVGIAMEGYWNNEKFTEFVSVLALGYRRGYGGMILVMDNSSYHKKAQEKKVGEALGIQIM